MTGRGSQPDADGGSSQPSRSEASLFGHAMHAAFPVGVAHLMTSLTRGARTEEGESIGMRSAAAFMASFFAGARAGAASPLPPSPAELSSNNASAPAAASTDASSSAARVSANQGHSFPELERIHRFTGSVAGSVFDELLNGALHPVDLSPPPASEKAMQNLERCVTCEESSQCPICLNDLLEATKMPCGHCFHDGCLLKWLHSHNTCPVCRSAIEPTEIPRQTTFSALLHGWQEAGAASATVARVEMATAPSGAAGSEQPAVSQAPDAAERIRGHLRDNVLHLDVPAPGFLDVPAHNLTPPFTEEEMQRMSVAELKRHLTELRVDFSEAIEKNDLLQLLRQHVQGPPRRMHLQVQMDILQFPLPQAAVGGTTVNASSLPTSSAVSSSGAHTTTSSAPGLRFRVVTDQSAGHPNAATSTTPAPAVPAISTSFVHSSASTNITATPTPLPARQRPSPSSPAVNTHTANPSSTSATSSAIPPSRGSRGMSSRRVRNEVELDRASTESSSAPHSSISELPHEGPQTRKRQRRSS